MSTSTPAIEYRFLSPNQKILLRKARLSLIGQRASIPSSWRYGIEGTDATECMYLDVGIRPSGAHRLVTINSNLPYSKDNCYWALSRGRRPTAIFPMQSLNSDSITLGEAVELSGITDDAILHRIKRMRIEQALLTPKSSRKPYPQDKAMQFFSNLNIHSDIAKKAVRNEQQSIVVNKSEQNIRDKYFVMSNDTLFRKIARVIDLELSIDLKSRILAFLACPGLVQKSTAKTLEHIIRRCRVDSDKNYEYYGGRGIGVCERWVSGDGELSGLYCFVIDVGPSQPGMELDRIDNDKGYEKSNCRWVTRKQNVRNTFRAEDIAARLNAMVEQRVAEELNRK